MDLLKNPIKELLNRYRSENKIIEIDQNARDKEIRAINDEMAQLSVKLRAYFGQSIESARKVYLTHH